MWIADMDMKTDPFVAEALRMRLDRDVLGYTSIPAEFYDVIHAWQKRYHGFDLDREWIGYAPGVITGINQAYLTFTEPGDKVIIQPPVYDHFRLYIERMGRVAVDNPLIFKDGRYQMDFDGLEKLFDDKTKILLLCNPQNPCGILWDQETLATLAEICDRHGVMVISDEIHADMALFGNKHIPFASVSDEAAQISITFGAPSKTFNIAGIVSSYAIVPNDSLRRRFYTWLEANELNDPPLFSPIATIAAYTQGEDYRQQMLSYIEDNIRFVEDYCREHLPQIKPWRPQASFLVWLDCRALGLSHDALVDLFVNHAHLALNDGAMFGIGGSGFMRLNVGTPRAVLRQALEQLFRAL